MLWAIASVAWTAPRDTVLVLPSATLACVRGRHQACVSPQYAWFIEAFAGERYSRVLLFFLVGFSAPCVWFVVPYMHPMTLYASSHFVRKMRMAHMHTQHPCRHRCVAQYGVAAMLGTNVACARTTAALISSVSLLHTSRTWTYSVSRLFTSITAASFTDTGTPRTQRCEFFFQQTRHASNAREHYTCGSRRCYQTRAQTQPAQHHHALPRKHTGQRTLAHGEDRLLVVLQLLLICLQRLRRFVGP